MLNHGPGLPRALNKATSPEVGGYSMDLGSWPKPGTPGRANSWGRIYLPPPRDYYSILDSRQPISVFSFGVCSNLQVRSYIHTTAAQHAYSATMSYALILFMHPWSESKSERLQSLLPSARDYLLSPESQCSTWTFFTPSTRPKAPFQQLTAAPISKSGAGKPLLIGGVEIYESRAALDKQLDKPWFKAFQDATKQESLYSRDEEIAAWTPVGGFVSRQKREMHQEGTVVMLARFECKDAGKAKQAVVDALS